MLKRIVLIMSIFMACSFKGTAQNPQIVVDLPYPGTFNPQMTRHTSERFSMPINYRSPKALCSEMKNILEKTRLFISRYEGKSIKSDFAAIIIGENINDTIPRIEFRYDATHLIGFMSYISGINIDSSGMYPIPGLLKSLDGINGLLEYYNTHDYNCDEVYTYWQIYILDYYVGDTFFERIPFSDKQAAVGEVGWIWDENDDEVIKKWPDSKFAALLKMGEYSARIRSTIYNILNKPNVTDIINDEKIKGATTEQSK